MKGRRCFIYPLSINEANNSRRKMNNIVSELINDPSMVEKATTSKTKSPKSARKNQPRRHKSHPSPNVHPSMNRPSQQDKSDGRRSKLKVDKISHGTQGL